jgi:hypothetical protein
MRLRKLDGRDSAVLSTVVGLVVAVGLRNAWVAVVFLRHIHSCNRHLASGSNRVHRLSSRQSGGCVRRALERGFCPFVAVGGMYTH